MKGWMILTAALLLAGCGGGGEPAAPRNEAELTVDTAAAAEEIRAAEAQWNRDYAARDVDALVGHYAPDATLVEPGAVPKTGTDAIRAGLSQMTSDPAFRLEFGSDEVKVATSGDLGYSRGRFTITMTDAASGQPSTLRGSYLTVWQRQEDGSWKAIEDFITPGPAEGAE